MDITSADWSSLPEHLLSSIAKRLDTRVETLRFRSVCNSFRSSVPPPRPLSPRTGIKIPFPQNLAPYGYGDLLLAESTIYAIEPINTISQTTETWLLKVEELSSGKVRVGDPLFKLCSTKFSQMLPESLNLLDYRVKEVTRVYRLQLETNKFDPSCFRKVVVSGEDDEGKLGVMALVNGGKVGVWRSDNKTWRKIDVDGNGKGLYFEDVIFHKEKFFAIASDGRTITVDPESLNVSEIAAPLTKSNHGLISLVKSSDDLLLIDKYWLEKYNKFGLGSDDKHGTVRLDVYKLDEEKREWIKMNDGLEDRVLFLGEDYSFLISPKEYCGCRGNRIYLFDKDFSQLDFGYPAISVVMFYLEDDNAGWSYGISSYSQIFWPPPSWLKQH